MTNIYSDLVSRSSFPASSMRAKYFPFEGGEILTDPALSQPPGSLLYGKNYEVYPEGGYRRIDGYERFDGKVKPSDSLYWTIDFQTGAGDVVDTDIIGGASSGAIGEVVAAPVIQSGTISGGDAVGYYVLALVEGVFTVGENLQVNGVTKSVVKGAAEALGATVDELDSLYSTYSIERARSKIGAVSGSGPIRGVWVYNGIVYAFRDNVGATSCHMHYAATDDVAARETYTPGGTIVVGDIFRITISDRAFRYAATATTAESVVDGIAALTNEIEGHTVTSVTVTAGGSGYTDPETTPVTFSAPPSGLTATGSVTISAGAISAITVENSGSGYATAPTITIGGAGTGATATATITASNWTNYIKTLTGTLAGGTGYTSVPTVTITGGGGSGALAEATVVATVVTAITLIDSGAGYTSAPTVTITGGAGSGAAFTSAAITTGSLKMVTGTNVSDTLQLNAVLPGTASAFSVSLYTANNSATLVKSADTISAVNQGWVQVDLGQYIRYTSGTGVVSIGDTLSGSTSGATGYVRRVIIQTGAHGTGNAKGIFVLSNITGTFQTGEPLQVNASTKAASSSALETVNLIPGGRYEFENYNFGGTTSTNRMYGCDGFNPAFEFDGDYWIPIFTGMDVDSPRHIAAHKKHLFLSFTKGSLQHSSIGDPYGWTVVTGASELGTGDEITALQVMKGDAMAVFNRNRSYILYGTSSANWNLRTFSVNSGGIEWTIQNLTETIYLDDRGITNLAAVNAYGDFAVSTLSKKIKPIIDTQKGNSLSSLRVRKKGQYRLFFSDGSGVYGTFTGNRLAGFIRVDLGKPVYTVCSAEDSLGDEIMFFGSDDGYVYQMDKGTSFDGTAIEGILRLSYYHFDTPTRNKRFRKIHFEMRASSNIELKFQPDFTYGSVDVPEGRSVDLDIAGGGGFWNIADWNTFNWSGQVVTTAEESIDGMGTNMGILILSQTAYEQPHILQGVTVHYSNRRIRR